MRTKTLWLGLTLSVAISCSTQKSADQTAFKKESKAGGTRISTDSTEQKRSSSKTNAPAREETRPPAELGRGLGPQGPPVLHGTVARGATLRAPRSAQDEGRSLLVALDTPYQIFEGRGSYVHVGAWRTDGTPAAGASVFVGSEQLGKTNEHGALVFMYPPPGRKNASIAGSHVLTVVDARDADLQGHVPFSPQLRTASFASDHVFVYTDRGVYRPGDEVHLRSIAWHLKEDYEPVRGQELEFQLRGPRGAVITGARVKTDDFGVGSATLRLPPTVIDGTYELKVGYKRATQTARIQVREFTPPTIQIGHDLGRFLTGAQRKLEANVTLRPSSGRAMGQGALTWAAEVDGARQLEITRKVRGPGPHRVAASSSQWAALRAKLTEGTRVKMTLKIQTGQLPPEETVREMRFTQNPYVAVLELDKDQYTTDDKVAIVARVRDLDGVGVRQRKLTLRVGKKTWTQKTSDAGTATFRLEMGAKAAKATLHVDGVKGAIATKSLRWSPPRAMVSHVAEPVLKERGFAHVEVRFPAGVEPVEKVVHMDVVDTSGALVNAVLLPVSRDRRGYVARGKFQSPSWGSMLLTFFALGRDALAPRSKTRPHHGIGMLTEGQSLVVRPDRELKVVLDGIPDRASPGQTLQIQAKVQDARGQAVEASVGASVVDGRVISLADPLEITPMDHFYQPTLRTMSTTGSKILSWPVVSRNWGSRRHDVALPPFPFLTGGPVTRSSSAAFGMKTSKDLDGEPPPPPSPSAKTSGSTRREGEGERDRRATAAAPKVTIRTRFEETSMWRPNLRAQGAASFDAKLPDSIAEQEVMVVASDAQGGVGVARTRVRVTQDLHIRADFPTTLRAGTRLDVPLLVTSTHKEPQQVLVAMTSKTLGRAIEKKTVTVPAGGTVTVPMRVHAATPGVHSYQVGVSAPGLSSDLVDASVRVLPTGSPSVTTRVGHTSRGKPWKTTWKVSPDSRGNDAFLNIAFPAITAGVVDFDRLATIVRQDPLSLSSDLVTAALVLQYARRHKLSSRRVDHMRARLLGATGGLYGMQQKDGAFVYWRSRKASALVTAWALEGLLEVQRADLPVRDDAIKRAVAWLLDNIARDGLIDVSEIAFWQGDTKDVRMGLTAEVFDVLSSLPKRYHSKRLKQRLTTWTKLFVAHLQGPATRLDPLTSGRALRALGRSGALSASQIRGVLKRLLLRRDRGHWEPSWFHAYAGQIEATAAMISVMHQLSPTTYAAEIRDALSYILSTRQAWGQWHNERGTAAALRALLLVGAAPDAIGGTLTVKRDGKTLTRVKVDPKDPFGSTLAIRHLLVGENLSPGDHALEVNYTGKLAPSIMLGAREWRPATSKTAQSGKARLSVRAPKSGSVGSTATLSVQVSRPGGPHPAVVHIAPSGLGELDLASLAAWVAETSEVKGYRHDEEGVTVELSPTCTSVTLALTYKLWHTGEGSWPTIAMRDGTKPAIVATAGSLKVR